MNVRVSRVRLRLTSLGAVAAATVLLAGACSSGSSKPAAGIQPGAGQSPAGAPGATGSGSMSSSMPGMTMTGGASNTASAAAPVGGNAVAIQGFAFAPANLSVKVGTTVTWTNKDSDAHTVTSQGSGGPLQSKALATGESFSYTFTAPGTYSYLCTIHPFMTATVTVTQ
ncbi:MAG: cupredoxin family copper-binding protein [Catenulispora sp.]|nr:cupredoxin family copper-binding protein [Catenulispora sp.]